LAKETEQLGKMRHGQWTYHLSRKPGNVTEFDSCRENVRGVVREKSCQGKLLNLGQGKLFTASFMFAVNNK